MNPGYVSYGFLLSFITTVLALRQFESPVYPQAMWTMLFMLLAACALAAISRNTRQPAAIAAGSLAGVMIAFWTVSIHAYSPTPTSIELKADERKVILTGRIAEPPDRRPMQTKYVIEVSQVQEPGKEPVKATGRVLVSDHDGWPQYKYLQTTIVEGKLQRPGMIEDFSYDNYLRLYEIYSVIYRAKVSASADGDESCYSALSCTQAILVPVRDAFEYRINRLFPEPHASLLAGLLLGSRSGLPEDLTESFRRAGLSHIVAISGYNITIILTVMMTMLFWLPGYVRTPLLVMGVATFTLLVGASASVVRAAIMGSLGLIALQSGRSTTTRLSILWAAFFMLLWKPCMLWFDGGFQLSFAAVLGLSELSPWLDRIFRRAPDFVGLRTSLTATLAAQIATAPLLLKMFGYVPMVSPIANLAIAPLIPLAMLFGFLGTILNMVSEPAGKIIGYLAWGLMELIILIAQVAGAV